MIDMTNASLYAIVSERETQFANFDQWLDAPIWQGSKILDFGGNVGGFLTGAGSRVNQDDYWCLDLNRQVIEIGGEKFPHAHFCHYNRYSPAYNPDGIRDLPIPDLGLKFDIILAFSVFTHTHQEEMLELVGQLRDKLSPQGVLAFTFTDPNYEKTLTDPSLPPLIGLRKVLGWLKAEHRSIEIEDLIETASQSNWCLLIEDKLYVEPGSEFSNQKRQGKPWESYCSYFRADHMSALFPDAKVLPPISPEWQHCCILRKE
jgi:SAM-dependent methyltransferase